MRIGVDACILSASRRTGIGRYAFSLLEAMAPQAAGRVIGLFFPRGRGCPDLRGGCFRRIGGPVPDDLREDRFHRLWLDLYLPLRIAAGGFDVFHGPSYLLPRARGVRTVVTVHDLTHEKFPQWAAGCSAGFARRARESVRRADAVIAVSAATRDDVLEVYGVAEEKVRVIHEAAGAAFRPVGDRGALEECRRRHGLPERFVLSVLSLHPRKNIRGLIRAFSIAKRDGRLPHRLALAGKEYAGGGDGAAGPGDEIIPLRYVPEDDLPLLYNLADAFVFPSFYEGFGLPPLEAMACGRPVAASNVASLPEVLGDAARYFDPHDVRGMAAAIREVLEPGAADDLGRRGLARAAMFSWERAAAETLALYDELASGRAPRIERD
ncbi:MAG: glycosyltransferase family 1 protein [bacterium]|nr:glycosyltransferase family 1 protein [bacterium]